MKNQIKLSLVSGLVIVAQLYQAPVRAEEVSTSETEISVKEKSVDEADKLITNRQMRAEMGSLSNWSSSMFLKYDGGSFAEPLNPIRPNIVRGGDVPALQRFTGEIGVRYRIDALNSLTASTGVNMVTPFHTNIEKSAPKAQRDSFDDNAQRLDIQNPFLRYVHVNKFFGLQSASTVEYGITTDPQLKNEIGIEGYLTLSEKLMYDVGQTGLTLGTSFAGTFYDLAADRIAGATSKLVGFYPQAEYVINDVFNLRTVVGLSVWENLAGQDSGEFTKRKVYQSVGLGISVTRDIFLYPNFQFIPSNMNSEVTNFAFNANINLF
jgi:hypothetical protein